MPIDDANTLLRQANRHALGELWQNGTQSAEISPERRRLLQAMEAHREFYPLWDRLPHLTRGELMVGDMNPLVHITLHATVEAQVEAADPPEVIPTLDAVIKAGFTRHRALHLVGQQLAMELFAVLGSSTPDANRYQRRLSLIQHLAEDPKLAQKTGRNSPCPCGSGKKFKRCCIDQLGDMDVDPDHWHFLLPSHRGYLAADYTGHLPDDDPLRLMHNLSAVALALESQDDLHGALATYDDIAEIAATTSPEFTQNAMADAVEFGLRHPTVATHVLRHSEVLMASDGIRQHEDPCIFATVLLDHADLLTYAGRVDEAATLYASAENLAQRFPHNEDLAAIIRARVDEWNSHSKSGD